MNEFCFEQIKKYEIFHVKSESDEESVVDTIGKLVCPNNCTANGICKEGTCIPLLIQISWSYHYPNVLL